MLKTFLYSIVIAIIIITAIIISIIRDNNNEGFSELELLNKKANNSFLINQLNIDSTITTTNFPYKEYLSLINISKPKKINKTVFELGEIINDTLLAQDILQIAFTEKLKESLNPKSYDSLRMFLSWADKMNSFSVKDKTTKYFYKAIHSYWYQYAIDILKEKTDDKYLFKYKYLSQRCVEQKYYPVQKKSNIDKIFNYTIEKKWTYLFSRFWGGTGILFKIAVFVLFIITIISYIILVKYLIKKINKNEKE